MAWDLRHRGRYDVAVQQEFEHFAHKTEDAITQLADLINVPVEDIEDTFDEEGLIARVDALEAADVSLDSRVDALEAASVIDHVEYGDVAVNNGNSSGTATIAAVDTTKAFLSYLGANGSATNHVFKITLTNSTTITATRDGTSGDATVNFCIVEFV